MDQVNAFTIPNSFLVNWDSIEKITSGNHKIKLAYKRDAWEDDK
jgi:hypothetical protein